MAEYAYTTEDVGGFGNNATIVQWVLDATNTTGSPFGMPGSAIRSVQIQGTFDTATMAFAGSNDGTNYVTLTDPQGNAISGNTARLEQVSEVTRFVKPVMTSPQANTSIVVTLLSVRRGQ